MSSLDKSRRWFMSLAAGAPAAAIGVAAAPSAPALSPPLPLPLTPAEYLAELHAIGWRAVAMCFDGMPRHCIEYGPEDWRQRTPENQYAFALIQRRVSKSGDDFWKRTSRYLFDLGLREEVLS